MRRPLPRPSRRLLPTALAPTHARALAPNVLPRARRCAHCRARAANAIPRAHYHAHCHAHCRAYPRPPIRLLQSDTHP